MNQLWLGMLSFLHDYQVITSHKLLISTLWKLVCKKQNLTTLIIKINDYRVSFGGGTHLPLPPPHLFESSHHSYYVKSSLPSFINSNSRLNQMFCSFLTCKSSSASRSMWEGIHVRVYLVYTIQVTVVKSFLYVPKTPRGSWSAIDSE